MNRFFLLALTAGLLSSIAANADDFNVRDTCGRLHAVFILPKESHKRLGLPKNIPGGRGMGMNPETTSFYDLSKLEQEILIGSYCDEYTGVSDVYYN